MQTAYPIETIGGAALSALEDGASGRVLAVFHRSLYVEMDAGRLACVGGPKLGNGPLNAPATIPPQMNFETQGPAPGDPASVDGEILTIGGKTAFELRDAALWEPLDLPGVESATVTVGLEGLRRAISSYQNDIGLGASISGIAPRQNVDQLLLDRATPAIGALSAWISTTVHDSDAGEPVPDDASRLIGLGPGLTPSGDDWLGGAMIALRAAGQAETATALARWVMPSAHQRTGKISVAHLAAAANGEGSAVLHEMMGALVCGDEKNVEKLLSRIDAIGHSSGWDALAGVVAILEIISQ